MTVILALSMAGGVAEPLVSGLSFWQGAFAGALVIGAAVLAGLSVLGRSANALCALLMTASAGVLALIWLGLVPSPSTEILLVVAGSFAAATVLFVSSSISSVRDSQLVSGLLFAGALAIVGISVINLVLGGEAAGLMRTALGAGAAVVLGLTGYGAFKGDHGARLIAPGAVIAALGPIAALQLGGGAPMAAALFGVGVLGAAVIAGADAAIRNSASASAPMPIVANAGYREPVRASHHTTEETQLRISENQLAQVLDYSGVAVWDWSHEGVHQTKSFGELMGADGTGDFTPESMAAFFDDAAREKFDRDVIGLKDGDGGFDTIIDLVNGKRVRMRGARAVMADESGLERIVIFLEEAPANATTGVDPLRAAAASLTAAAAVAGLRRHEPHVSADDIVGALDRNEIQANFQPIVSLDKGEVVGFEALMRWPDGGSKHADIAPQELLRAAAQAGRGEDLSRVMIKAAAAKVAEARESTKGKVFVAFNTSVSQLLEPGFVDLVREAISEYDLPADALVLELTESERIKDVAKVGEIFSKLKASGVRLAFDDFGAGFSCLQNLARFSFDYLKIDKSFVERIADEPGAAKIVAALAGLGRDLKMQVIAEGVETKKAADAARKAGCVMAQGYLFGEPVADVLKPVEASKPAALAEMVAEDEPAPTAVAVEPEAEPVKPSAAEPSVTKKTDKIWAKQPPKQKKSLVGKPAALKEIEAEAAMADTDDTAVAAEAAPMSAVNENADAAHAEAETVDAAKASKNVAISADAQETAAAAPTEGGKGEARAIRRRFWGGR